MYWIKLEKFMIFYIDLLRKKSTIHIDDDYMSYKIIKKY